MDVIYASRSHTYCYLYVAVLRVDHTEQHCSRHHYFILNALSPISAISISIEEEIGHLREDAESSNQPPLQRFVTPKITWERNEAE